MAGLPASTVTDPSRVEVEQAFALDAPEAPAEPAQPAVAAPVPATQPEPVVAPAVSPETPASTEPALDQVQAPPEAFAFAGRRFPTLAEAERSYTEMQARATRAEQERVAAASRIAEYDQLWTQVRPILEQQQTAPTGPAIDFTEDPTGALRQIVEPLQQQITRLQQQVQNPQPVAPQYDPAIEEARQRNLVAAQAFLSRHPDVQPGTPVYQGVDALLRDHRYNLDVTDTDQMELALEMWQSPQLASAVALAPAFARDPYGRQLLRQQVQPVVTQPYPAPQAAPNGNGTPAGATPPARPGAQAFVETGGTGTPIPSAPGSAAEKDDFDRVVSLAESLRKNSSPLMGGRKS